MQCHNLRIQHRPRFSKKTKMGDGLPFYRRPRNMHFTSSQLHQENGRVVFGVFVSGKMSPMSSSLENPSSGYLCLG